jgi:hypothetical protein
MANACEAYIRVMRFRSRFNYCCAVVGRASAIITFAGMGSLVLVATVVDVLR